MRYVSLGNREDRLPAPNPTGLPCRNGGVSVSGFAYTGILLQFFDWFRGLVWATARLIEFFWNAVGLGADLETGRFTGILCSTFGFDKARRSLEVSFGGWFASGGEH